MACSSCSQIVSGYSITTGYSLNLIYSITQIYPKHGSCYVDLFKSRVQNDIQYKMIDLSEPQKAHALALLNGASPLAGRVESLFHYLDQTNCRYSEELFDLRYRFIPEPETPPVKWSWKKVAMALFLLTTYTGALATFFYTRKV